MSCCVCSLDAKRKVLFCLMCVELLGANPVDGSVESLIILSLKESNLTAGNIPTRLCLLYAQYICSVQSVYT